MIRLFFQIAGDNVTESLAEFLLSNWEEGKYLHSSESQVLELCTELAVN